jgi:hypothetical protein
MAEPRRQVTVGLFKKSEDCTMEDYLALATDGAIMGGMGPDIGKDFEELVQMKLQQMNENPEQFFNFGFTYNDFKSYLFKLTYCRAVRIYIEAKRLERIAEFQKNNQFTIGFEMEEQQQPNPELP